MGMSFEGSSAARIVCRRHILGAIVAVASEGGADPTAAQSRVLQRPAVPCTGRPGEIASLVLEGSGAPAGTVVVFGQVFRPGDLPRDMGLGARIADGRPVAAQLDVKTRHSDGSARFALVSVAAPALRQGEHLGVLLERRVATMAPLDYAAALTGRSAIVEIGPSEGGPIWRADLLEEVRRVLAAGPGPAIWQWGPLAVQGRTVLPVSAAGTASARLVADIAIRADELLVVDVWLRNDLAMRPAGGKAQYGIRVLLDGKEVVRRPPTPQYQYTGWGRRGMAARGGTVVAALPRARQDIGLFIEVGALPRFDLSVGIAEETVARMAALMAAPAWSAPDDPRGITRYLPTSGGRADIGFVTGWQAIWLHSGDRRAAEFVLGQAEAAGSAPWHMWDSANGTWLNLSNYPRLWIDVEARGGTGRPGDATSGGLTQRLEGYDFASGGSQGMSWELDRTHQPDLSYVPYLLTGERWILDNLQAQSAWNTMSISPGMRQFGQGLLVAPDPNNQVRDIAWSMRQVENALWASPDGSPEKAYFQTISNNNWKYLVSKIPEWTAAQGETYGWIPSGMGAKGEIPPWQQDFLAGITALAAGRGNEDALTFLKWQANYLVGRFTHADQGMNPRDGIAYQMMMVDPATGQPLKSWGAVGAAMVQAGASNGTGWEKSGGYFGQLGLASLAEVYNLTGSQAAADAYRAILSLRPPATDPASYASSPTFNVVPKGFSRVPGRAIRCTATAAPKP
jgi:hypothetical protein